MAVRRAGAGDRTQRIVGEHQAPGSTRPEHGRGHHLTVCLPRTSGQSHRRESGPRAQTSGFDVTNRTMGGTDPRSGFVGHDSPKRPCIGMPRSDQSCGVFPHRSRTRRADRIRHRRCAVGPGVVRGCLPKDALVGGRSFSLDRPFYRAGGEHLVIPQIFSLRRRCDRKATNHVGCNRALESQSG